MRRAFDVGSDVGFRVHPEHVTSIRGVDELAEFKSPYFVAVNVLLIDPMDPGVQLHGQIHYPILRQIDHLTRLQVYLVESRPTRVGRG